MSICKCGHEKRKHQHLYRYADHKGGCMVDYCACDLFQINESHEMPEDSLTRKRSVGLESKTENGGSTPPPRISPEAKP